MIRLAVLLGLCVADPSLACEPPLNKADAIDNRIRVGPQCEYDNAAPDDNYLQVNGKPVVDIGGGKIGQRQSSSDSCFFAQQMMFVDCSTAELIVIDGINEDSGIAGMGAQSVTKLQRAGGGPIALGPKTTVAELARISDRHSFDYKLGADIYRRVEARNRVDPYCGCKLYYPGSAGAGR